MTTVTEEMRKKELLNQQKFQEGIPKLEGYTRQNEANLLSTRAQLMKRLEHSTAQVPFFDGEEEFSIEVRMLSPSEQQQILELQFNLAKFKNSLTKAKKMKPEEMKKAAEEAKMMLDKLVRWVAEICTDKELDYDYWKAGEGFSSDVPAHIIAEALKASTDYAKDLKWFRKK